jgi:hypothetical protein
MPNYYRLFYVSTRTYDLNEENVDRIAQDASVRNAENDIVGALCYNGVNFGQVLEGEKTAVLDLVERIKADTRHTGMIIVSERTVEGRHFQDWSMKRIKGMEFDELIAAMNT